MYLIDLLKYINNAYTASSKYKSLYFAITEEVYVVGNELCW
jgi:hypothetical protein